MAYKTCMNGLCGVSTSIEWRKGWVSPSGDVVDLCDKCGSAYEQSLFCEVFHSKTSGWRECISCGKRLHCGCIASSCLFEFLANANGVNCISCAKKSGFNNMIKGEKRNGSDKTKGDGCQLHSMSAYNQSSGIKGEKRNGSDKTKGDGCQLHSMSAYNQSSGIKGEKRNGSDKTKGDGCQLHSMSAHNQSSGASIDNLHLMQLRNDAERIGLRQLLQLHNDGSSGSFVHTKQDELSPPAREIGSTCMSKVNQTSNGSLNAFKSLSQPNLSMSLGGSSENRNIFPGSYVDAQASKSRHLLSKPPRSISSTGMLSQISIARPPGEGRGRNQLLPRYWPKITQAELQQISGDSSSSTIVPLFEKVLSASDAGRIGRLVLPKACAEAYFPPISQPEGLAVTIQDLKGKEWTFQFRFWPNNNSRMYVLEGVTPCIQSMQLEAGDTVTFSRKEPEGMLIMGFRKATNVTGMQSSKRSTDPRLNGLCKDSCSSDMHDDETKEDSEKKRTRNVGSKSKRLRIDSQDALELKVTWEEAQDFFHPPPSIKPSIVTIEGYDFEEYDKPPVFGNRSIFAVRSSGEQDQWVQCDSCSKWRRLPVDALIPHPWTCADNNTDQSRSSCSAPDELTPSELEDLRLNKDLRKRRRSREHGSSSSLGLNALASAATLGDNVAGTGTTKVATTTKHPRHRPGCSCIVCSQPPSGKGKHNPTCTCNVCMTVKRRFKTMMMRKQKRQSERAAEIARRNQRAQLSKAPAEIESSSKRASLHQHRSENEARSVNELEPKSQNNNLVPESVKANKGQIDLNCDPDRDDDDDDPQLDYTRTSLMNLLKAANLPLETYLKENGLTGSVYDRRPVSPSRAPPHTFNASEPRDDRCFDSANEDRETWDNGETRPIRISSESSLE